MIVVNRRWMPASLIIMLASILMASAYRQGKSGESIVIEHPIIFIV
jgi:hypothetical protein